ncbi:MAG: cyanophycin synthetase [Candidatus Paceibacterota bacterium]
MSDLDLTKIKKVFFIGIGGIGISALAQMLFNNGISVSGVTDEEGKAVDVLRELGINVLISKTVFGIAEADLYVYSDAWLYRGPEIIAQARNTGKLVLSYFEALGEISKKYKVIAISGTHGKTTTSAMVAEMLLDAGLDPTVIVGSFVKRFGSNFKKGNSEYLVVEADEFNRHMLFFKPYIGAITNIEADHLDVYKDLNDIKSAFEKFLAQSENKIVDYSKYLDKVPELLVPGEHNRKNAALALAVADVLGINEEISKKSLASFSGTWRRLEKRGVTEKGTIVYDDYAHHPTEVKASLQALRELYPRGTKVITVVFQPHLYSRTKDFFKEFSEAFDDADNVILLPIYFAREDPDPSVSSDKLAEAICLHRGEAVAFKDFADAEAYVRGINLEGKDVFVTMGAGEAYKVADNVLKFK